MANIPLRPPRLNAGHRHLPEVFSIRSTPHRREPLVASGARDRSYQRQPRADCVANGLGTGVRRNVLGSRNLWLHVMEALHGPPADRTPDRD
jgi:hypothetical protein